MELQLQLTICPVIEAMLPRFSDKNLGVLLGFSCDVSDHGYGKDGNTLERKPKTVREYHWFIFSRPSNYTKVFHWMSPDNARGLDTSPQYNSSVQWNMVSDHDSCWRDGFTSVMHDAYFRMTSKFEGRKMGDKLIAPCELSHFHHLDIDPKYVEISNLNRVYPNENQYSPSGRIYTMKFTPIDFTRLQGVKISGNMVGLKIIEKVP